MDPFGYNSADSYSVNGAAIGQAEEFQLQRDELRQVRDLARRRYGRRRLFRTGELEAILEEVRGFPLLPDNAPGTIRRDCPRTVRRQLEINMNW